MRLPVDAILPDVRAAVRDHGGAIVTAPPGSGKTTRVPPALLDVVQGAVWVLQPRRVAARLTAQRIAHERGVRPGDEVGWRVRFDDRSSASTRLLVVTEGLLTRRLQDDPFLDGIDAVVIDEVHERSLNVDLALALLREVRREARPDLALVVMSATLDAGPLGEWLGLPVLDAPGRTFPVDVEYEGERTRGPLADHVARAVRRHHGTGNTLVFLPGRRAIHQTASRLSDLSAPVFTLHGGMPLAEQQRALDGSGPDRIVLTTNLAETSVTVPGVRTVIDSGLVKTLRFDPALGLDRLVTERVSEASATQRAGRAGRTGPGRAIRLWSAGEHLAPFTDPAIQREDLADLLLQVWDWGTTPERLDWLQAPSAAQIAVARQLLEQLGALRDDTLTPLGHTMVGLPLPPRLGAILATGHELGAVSDAAGMCALLSEPDPWRHGVPGAHIGCDVRARLAQLGSQPRLRKVRDQLLRLARQRMGPATDHPFDDTTVAHCALAGFPDRVGQRVGQDRYRLASGRAELSDGSLIEDEPFIVALSVRGAQRGEHAEHIIDLGVPVARGELPVREVTHDHFDKAQGAIVQRTEERVGELVIGHRDVLVKDSAALAQHARVDHLSVSDTDQALLHRVNLLARLMPELDQQPLELDDLLPILCEGITRLRELGNKSLGPALQRVLSWQFQAALDQHAPTHLALPSGSRTRLHYDEAGASAHVRVQQVFGWTHTPTIANGRHPITLHLLSPARRPVQITQDLAGFWAGSWVEVRKEMRGRYPKHTWPEDPANATAHDRPKRRR